jgi:hypothetical protein
MLHKLFSLFVKPKNTRRHNRWLCFAIRSFNASKTYF